MKEELQISISESRRLIEVVNKTYGFDLGNYAFTSFKRRVMEVMEKNEINNIDNLISRIEKNAIFYKSFIRDINVEVTELFRDPSLWRYLKDNIFPVLAENFRNLKFWVPNCSSGEELYSLLIMLNEMNMLKNATIFATDHNDGIITKSKNGSFPNSKYEASEANIKRVFDHIDVNRYFTKNLKDFKIDSNLLENTQFQLFDLTKLEQLKRGFHVILFRNNFIYYKSNLQENLVTLFHNSLALNGYLIIGNKETISWCKDANKYTAINPGESVYKKTLV